jgi:glycosyltransferase involved in cell wall biosynthesis
MGRRVPTVSVLMPAYNAAAYLREAADSILAQTYADFELLIVDDGSTDATPDLLSDFTDDRVRRLRNDRNLGIPGTRNRCLAEAQGEYVAWMDADDRSRPERLQHQLDYLRQHPELAAVGSWAQVIDEAGAPLKQWHWETDPQEIREVLPGRNCIVNGSTLARRAALQAIGGFRLLVAEDYDLWLRLTDQGACLANLPEMLYEYRIHGTSDTAQKKYAYSVATFLLQESTRRRRSGLRDPLDGLDLAGCRRLIEKVGQGKGKLGRSWKAEQHWHRACEFHAQGMRLPWLREFLLTGYWRPGSPVLWQALASRLRRSESQ